VSPSLSWSPQRANRSRSAAASSSANSAHPLPPSLCLPLTPVLAVPLATQVALAVVPVQRPQLWWPKQMGTPKLYTITLTFTPACPLARRAPVSHAGPGTIERAFHRVSQYNGFP